MHGRVSAERLLAGRLQQATTLRGDAMSASGIGFWPSVGRTIVRTLLALASLACVFAQGSGNHASESALALPVSPDAGPGQVFWRVWFDALRRGPGGPYSEYGQGPAILLDDLIADPPSYHTRHHAEKRPCSETPCVEPDLIWVRLLGRGIENRPTVIACLVRSLADLEVPTYPGTKLHTSCPATFGTWSDALAAEYCGLAFFHSPLLSAPVQDWAYLEGISLAVLHRKPTAVNYEVLSLRTDPVALVEESLENFPLVPSESAELWERVAPIVAITREGTGEQIAGDGRHPLVRITDALHEWLDRLPFRWHYSFGSPLTGVEDPLARARGRLRYPAFFSESAVRAVLPRNDRTGPGGLHRAALLAQLCETATGTGNEQWGPESVARVLAEPSSGELVSLVRYLVTAPSPPRSAIRPLARAIVNKPDDRRFVLLLECLGYLLSQAPDACEYADVVVPVFEKLADWAWLPAFEGLGPSVARELQRMAPILSPQDARRLLALYLSKWLDTPAPVASFFPVIIQLARAAEVGSDPEADRALMDQVTQTLAAKGFWQDSRPELLPGLIALLSGRIADEMPALYQQWQSRPARMGLVQLAGRLVERKLNSEQVLRKALGDPDTAVRAEAALMLALLKPSLSRRLGEDLIDRLVIESDPRVRLLLCDAIGACGDVNVAEKLAEMARDRQHYSPKQRADFLFALRSMGQTAGAAAPLIAELVADPSTDVAVGALHALAATGRRTASAAAVLATEDPRWPVRAAAARALGGLRVNRADVWERLLDDPEPMVQLAACACASELSREDQGGEVRRIQRKLAVVASDEMREHSVRIASLRALYAIGLPDESTSAILRKGVENSRAIRHWFAGPLARVTPRDRVESLVDWLGNIAQIQADGECSGAVRDRHFFVAQVLAELLKRQPEAARVLVFALCRHDPRCAIWDQLDPPPYRITYDALREFDSEQLRQWLDNYWQYLRRMPPPRQELATRILNCIPDHLQNDPQFVGLLAHLAPTSACAREKLQGFLLQDSAQAVVAARQVASLEPPVANAILRQALVTADNPQALENVLWAAAEMARGGREVDDRVVSLAQRSAQDAKLGLRVHAVRLMALVEGDSRRVWELIPLVYREGNTGQMILLLETVKETGTVPGAVVRLLPFMARHPSPQLRRLAAQLLKQGRCRKQN